MSIIVTDEAEQQSPRANGKSQYLQWLVTMAIAALVGYFSGQSAINAEIASIRATQNSQFGEVLRRLDLMQQDIRELRNRP